MVAGATVSFFTARIANVIDQLGCFDEIFPGFLEQLWLVSLRWSFGREPRRDWRLDS